jgi:hypothetical protein
MKVSKVLAVVLMLLMVAGFSFAGNPEKKGTAGAEELLIPMGARGTALAGAALASINGVDAIYWNPAGLANTESSVEATFSYMSYIADINVSYGAIGVKTGLGSLGASFQSLSFGEIPETTEDSPNGTGSFFSPVYMTLGATYSRAMTDRIFVGVNLKFISEKIMQTSASAFALDMGVQYLTEAGIRLGVALKNLGSPLQFDGPNMDRDVDIPDTPPGSPIRKLRFPSQKAELPSLFEIGLAYDIKPMEKANITVMGNYRNHNFANDQILAGVELSYDNRFFLRGGYDYGMNEGTDAAGGDTYQFGPTFGFGIIQPVSGNTKLGFDFAYRMVNTTYFDNNMYFTAKLLF